MVKNTYFECDNCDYKILIDSTREYCEENEYTIIFRTCWYCNTDYCEDCIEKNKIICNEKCGHDLCKKDRCIDSHSYQCPILDKIYEREQKEQSEKHTTSQNSSSS